MKFERPEQNTEVPEHQLFSIVHEGRFDANAIDYDIVQPGSTLKRTDDSEAYLEQEWQSLLASGFKAWPNDTKPNRYRFVGAKEEEGRLKITLDPCVSYRDFVGGIQQEFIHKFGNDAAPNPLAVTVLLLAKTRSGEEQVLITLRKPGHDYKAGGMHVSTGGWVEITKNETPASAAQRELFEEAGLKSNEINDFHYRALVHNQWTYHPDMIFQASTDIAVEDLKERLHDNENDILFVPTERIKLQQWILAPMHANTTIGVAGLLLIGKERYGEAWYDEMNKALAWRSKDYTHPEERERLERRDIERLAQKVNAINKPKD